MVKEILLLSFSFKDDDGIVGLNVVVVNLMDGFLNKLLFLMLGMLKLFDVMFEVRLFVVLGLKVVFERMLIFFVGFLYFLHVRNQYDLMDFEGPVLRIRSLVLYEVLKSSPDSYSMRDVLDDN